MATFDIVMPKLGESVQEATITKWFKKPGDMIEEEEVLLEIATDKVDSEIECAVNTRTSRFTLDHDPVGQPGSKCNLGHLQVAVTKPSVPHRLCAPD